MRKMEFEIKGICPLKMDKWLDDAQPSSPDGYKKQAEKKTYTDEKGYLCIPASAVKATLKQAASELADSKKRNTGKKMRQTIMAQLFVEPINLLLLPLTKKHDGLAEDVVVRGTGDKVTRVKTYRPSIKEWKCKGKLAALGVEPEFLKEALDLAGMKYGLLSHRPEYGRFEVTKFTEVRK